MSAKKASPDVEIELGGVRRKIVFNMWAFCQLETATGKNALSGEIWEQPSATDIVTLLWAALQQEEPSLTIEEVGRMMPFSKLSAVSDALKSAFESAMPDIDPALAEAAMGKGKAEEHPQRG